MPSKPVQISLDTELLGRIDTDAETLEDGRSAFIRSAVRLYLEAKERERIDARLTRAYGTEADALLEEIEPLLGGQSWPTE